MKKIILIVISIIFIVAGCFIIKISRNTCPLTKSETKKCLTGIKTISKTKEGLELLKTRQDNTALAIFEEVLINDPHNTDALWGKAEILRRRREFKQAEELLNKILQTNPQYNPALLTKSYIMCKYNKFDLALKLINQVLKTGCLNREDQALAYMMLGAVNSERSSKGWLFSKIGYGTQIKCYFLKARDSAPELAEVHLGLGTFYLKAPGIIGGNLDKAIAELKTSLEIAPDFATANARLAQCYLKKGLQNEYEFYLNRAKALDPGNEVLEEIENSNEEFRN